MLFIVLMVILVLFVIIGGFISDIGEMVLNGVKELVFIGVMLMFVILYFGIMIDVGLFDLVVGRILKIVKGDLLKIIIGIVILVFIILLDGDGIIIYMIMFLVMFLFYKKLNMKFMILVCIVIMGSGVMNLMFWGGFIVCVMSVLKLDVF